MNEQQTKIHVFFKIFNLEPPKDDGGSEITKYIVELIFIHTNSFIIFTCPNPVLLVPGLRTSGLA
jgi:hypothetical protein